MPWTRRLAFGLGALAAAGVGAVAYGAWRWDRGSQAILARLEAARASPPVPRFDARELEGLPPPVQRYFRAALTDGQPVIAAASLTHAGSFNMSGTGEQWKPFTSKQRVVTRRPGFDWDARIMLLPGVPVHVHDAYVAGSGLLRGAVFGLLPVVDLADTPEVARGELLRFFAEAAWYPTALLPSQGVRWEAVEAASARATLTDGALTVTLLFRFGADGLIDTVRAQARDRRVDCRTVATPWQGRFWNPATRSGMRVPMAGEVAWLLPAGEQPYWRGTVTALAHEFAP